VQRSLVASPRVAIGLLLAAALVTKLLWGGAMGATTNEAYYYLYTVHPDWSYFDHPPMTMWVAKLGQVLCDGWVHPFSIRLGFTLLFAASTWIMFRWTARWYGEWAGVYAALLLNLSGFYAFTGGLASPDGPLLFFALLTMWALGEAVVANPRRTRPWVWVALAFAGALLSKYHAVFLPAGVALYAVATPGARHLLRRPGPYLAVGIGVLGFLPVVVWNAEHGWASFVFQGSRAVDHKLHLANLAGAVFGPVICLLPWVWGLLVTRLAVRARQFYSATPVDRLSVCLAVVPLAFFTAVGCVRWVMIYWPLIGFLPLFPMAGAKCSEWADASPRRWRWGLALAASPLLIGAVLAFAQVEWGFVRMLAPDAFTEARGWDSVAAELTDRGLTSDPAAFVFTNDWRASAQLGFALRNRVPVLCYSRDARGFAFWSDPAEWVGKTGLLVSTGDPANVHEFDPYFEKVEPVAEFPMRCGRTVLKRVRVFRCTNQRAPYPFGIPPKAKKEETQIISK
jgi:hypothetical protein